MHGSVLGLLFAILATAAIFGGAYLIVEEIVPAIMRGEGIALLRWGAVAVLTGFLGYRLFGRIRRRRRSRDESS